MKKGRQMGWVGAKRRHLALVAIHARFVLLLGRDGDGDITSEAEVEAAMTRRKVEHVNGEMFVYLKHGGAGGLDDEDDEEKNDDEDDEKEGDDGDDVDAGWDYPCATSPPPPATTPTDSHALQDRRPVGTEPTSEPEPRRRGGGRKIVLETSGREYRLLAETDEVARAWVAALKASVAAAAAGEDDNGVGGGSGGVGPRDGGGAGAGPGARGVASPPPPSPSTVPDVPQNRRRVTTPSGGVAARNPGGGGSGGGVSRADLELEAPVSSWELDSPASPQLPSPGSSWATATYQVERPAYINARF